MTSIANDDNSSIAFIDEDPPPYAVHCMLFYHNLNVLWDDNSVGGTAKFEPYPSEVQTKVFLGLSPI